jgi:hypothetical protein
MEHRIEFSPKRIQVWGIWKQGAGDCLGPRERHAMIFTSYYDYGEKFKHKTSKAFSMQTNINCITKLIK